VEVGAAGESVSGYQQKHAGNRRTRVKEAIKLEVNEFSDDHRRRKDEECTETGVPARHFGRFSIPAPLEEWQEISLDQWEFDLRTGLAIHASSGHSMEFGDLIGARPKGLAATWS
jgi:hypothetical protein